jgi:WD40 repeat protein
VAPCPDKLGGINALAASPCGHFVASAHDDGGIRIWSIDVASMTIQLVQTLHVHRRYATAVVFSPYVQCIASGAFDGHVAITDLRTGEVVNSTVCHTEAVSSLQFSDDCSVLLSAGLDGRIRLWEVATQMQCLKTILTDVPVVFARLSPNQRHVLAYQWQSSVRLWSLETSKAVRVFRGRHVAEKQFGSADFLLPASNSNAPKHTGIVFTSECGSVWMVRDLESYRKTQSEGSEEELVQRQVQVCSGVGPVSCLQAHPSSGQAVVAVWPMEQRVRLIEFS